MNAGKLEVIDSRFSANVAKAAEVATTTASAAGGGALSLWSLTWCRFNNTIFEENLATFAALGATSSTDMILYGGAAFIKDTSFVFSDVAFANNTVTDYYTLTTSGSSGQGGAIYMTASPSSRFGSLINCRFVSNAIVMSGTGIGGAVNSMYQLRLSISKGTTFVGNYVNITARSAAGGAYGGALYCSSVGLDVSDVSFEGNIVSVNSRGVASMDAWGGAVYASGTWQSGPRSFTSTVFTNNRAMAVLRTGSATTTWLSASGGALMVANGLTATLNVTQCEQYFSSFRYDGRDRDSHRC